MATTIKLKNGSGAPLAGDLVQGEPALDLTNKRLYTEDSGGTVIEVGTNPTSLTTGTFTSTGIDDNATSTAITIDSSQNVGIGTTSPSNPLNVIATNTNVLVEGSGVSSTGIAFETNNNTRASIGVASGSTALSFFSDAGSTETMRIDSSGRVGIGTSDPSSGTSTYYDDLVIKNATSGTGAGITIQSNTTNGFGAVEFRKADGTQVGKIYASSAGGQLAFETGGAERMRIDSSGNVGIGETAPSRALDIKSANPLNINTTSNNQIHFQVNDVTTGQYSSSSSLPHQLCDSTGSLSRLVVDSSGNVGIGTTSPASLFHVKIATDENIRFNSGGSGDTRISAINDAGSATTQLSIQGDPLLFRTFGGAEMARIDSSGNVGIGVIPESDWNSGHHALQLGETATFMGTVASDGNWISNNAIFSSSGSWEYIQTASASSLDMQSGVAPFRFRYAASGTAGTAISWSEAMRITSDAYLLVGTTSTTVNTTNFGTRIGGAASPTLKSFRNAGAGSTCCAFGGNAGEAIVKGDGDLENTNNSYGAISDARLKSNIVDASSQIDDIMAVQVRSYTLNETGVTHIGVVAQELEASGMSGLVKTDDEGTKSVKYSILYMKAIKALQEAVTRIETLEAEVAALKGA